MMNIEKLVSGIIIHKVVGKARKNCIYATSIKDVPYFLLKDGAIVDNGDGSITLYAIECPAIRKFPVYICYEKVSKENLHKVPGFFGAWPKDNGATTLMAIGKKCYNLPTNVKASLITDVVPEWVKEAGFPLARRGDTFELVRTDWGGEVRFGQIGKAMWVQYGPKDINILDLREQSCLEYVVSENGKDICMLSDLVAQILDSKK